MAFSKQGILSPFQLGTLFKACRRNPNEHQRIGIGQWPFHGIFEAFKLTNFNRR
jgi:hypothetical protein